MAQADKQCHSSHFCLAGMPCSADQVQEAFNCDESTSQRFLVLFLKKIIINIILTGCSKGMG